MADGVHCSDVHVTFVFTRSWLTRAGILVATGVFNPQGSQSAATWKLMCQQSHRDIQVDLELLKPTVLVHDCSVALEYILRRERVPHTFLAPPGSDDKLRKASVKKDPRAHAVPPPAPFTVSKPVGASRRSIADAL